MLIRTATKEDIPAIVEMLADDTLGKTREQFSKEIPKAYFIAFDAILQDKNASLLVVETDKKIIATAQVNYLQYLTYQGGKRALIEGVRVHKDYRGKNIGAWFMQNIIQKAKEDGCHLLQLTTNKARPEAKRFYEKLGFVASHEGMKLDLK